MQASTDHRCQVVGKVWWGGVERGGAEGLGRKLGSLPASWDLFLPARISSCQLGSLPASWDLFLQARLFLPAGISACLFLALFKARPASQPASHLTNSAATPFGAPNLWPTTVAMSTPSAPMSTRTLPRLWAASVCIRAPAWQAGRQVGGWGGEQACFELHQCASGHTPGGQEGMRVGGWAAWQAGWQASRWAGRLRLRA